MAELKQRLVDKANVPQDRQRIIYKGRVLENDQTLHSYGVLHNKLYSETTAMVAFDPCKHAVAILHPGVQQGHSLHLVERAPTAPAPAPAATNAQVPGQATGQSFDSAKHDILFMTDPASHLRKVLF